MYKLTNQIWKYYILRGVFCLVLVLLFSWAFLVSAATIYNLNCTADIVGSPVFNGGGGACLGATFVYTGSGYWTTSASILTGGTQWYVSYTASNADNIRW